MPFLVPTLDDFPSLHGFAWIHSKAPSWHHLLQHCCLPLAHSFLPTISFSSMCNRRWFWLHLQTRSDCCCLIYFWIGWIIGFLICARTTFFLSGENLTTLLNFWSMIETKLNYVRSKKIWRFLLLIMFWQYDDQGIIIFPTLLGMYINFFMIHDFLDVEYNITHQAISCRTNSSRALIILLLQGVEFNG